MHATLEVSSHHTTNVKKDLKILIACLIRNWAWFHWILLLVVVDLTSNLISLLPNTNIKSESFKCSLLTNGFEL
jgi:hypothetical protein